MIGSIDILTVAFFAASLLPALVLHELSHGIVADRQGDSTPRLAGRLTLNPVKHIDPFGTVILPALLLLPTLFGQGGPPVFAYAKPMPFNPQNLKDPDRQTMWIALAGPLTNLLLAVGGALLLRVTGREGVLGLFDGPPLPRFLLIFVFVNVLLAVFNIIPLPPLDGSKVIARFLPPRAREVFRSWDQYGALFILAIFFLLPGTVFGLIDPVVNGLLNVLL